MANIKKKQVNFRLPSTLIDTLKALAEAEDISVTDLVVELLEQSLAVRTQEPAASKLAIASSIVSFSPSSIDPPTSQNQYYRLAQELTALRKRVERLESVHVEEPSTQPLKMESNAISTDRTNSGTIPWL